MNSFLHSFSSAKQSRKRELKKPSFPFSWVWHSVSKIKNKDTNLLSYQSIYIFITKILEFTNHSLGRIKMLIVYDFDTSRFFYLQLLIGNSSCTFRTFVAMNWIFIRWIDWYPKYFVDITDGRWDHVEICEVTEFVIATHHLKKELDAREKEKSYEWLSEREEGRRESVLGFLATFRLGHGSFRCQSRSIGLNLNSVKKKNKYQ